MMHTAPAIPSTLRVMNKRALLRQLLEKPALSRAHLAKASGMGPATAGKIVDELLKEQILQEVTSESDTAQTVGRPGQLVSLDTGIRNLICIHLGVVHTRISAVALGFRDEDRWDIQINTPGDARSWSQALIKAIQSLKCVSPRAVFISAPGIVDESTSRILYSPNLHWSENFDFTCALRGTCKCPVYLVQEMHALAMGHTLLMPECRDFLMVDFGHGVGGTVVVNGELYRSPLPISGELGHTQIAGNTRLCGCGATGCVETLVTRRGMYASAFPSSRGDYDWTRIIRHIHRHGLEPWLRDAMNATASVIAGSLNVLGLERTVITGTLNEMPDGIRAYLSEKITTSALWSRFGAVNCDFAPRTRIRGLIKIALDRMILNNAHA